MAVKKFLGLAGALALGFTLFDLQRNNSSISNAISTSVNTAADFVHEEKGASGRFESLAPGYVVSVSQERLFGQPIRRELSLTSKEGYVLRVEWDWRSKKWNEQANNLPLSERKLFGNRESEIFEKIWPTIY